MKRINVAIIGHGRSGRDIHASTLSKLPGHFRITAVADESEERRSMARKDFGCDTCADYHELFARSDIDLIVNASPSNLHVPITLESLQHGFHVLCEKPLARKAADVDRIMAAAASSGKIVSVFQQARYNPAFVQMRKVLDSGVLGRIVQISIAYNGFSRRWDWQTMKSMNGGNLLNTGPHPLDQALQLFGPGDMPQVVCRMDQANSFGDAEDYVKIVLHGPGHPVVDIEISSCCAYPGANYQVQGTHGGLKGSFQRLEWKYFKPEEAPQQQLTSGYLRTGDGNPAYCAEELKWYEESWDFAAEPGKDLFRTMAEAYYFMLYDTLAHGKPTEVRIEEIRRQVAVMEQCFAQNPRFAFA
jgi:scyllo-inositol 2-dehydrogenase (NADP+)